VRQVYFNAVSPGYFALATRLIAGRDLPTATPIPRRASFAVNESLARRAFGDRDPIGQRLTVAATSPGGISRSWHRPGREVSAAAGVRASRRLSALASLPNTLRIESRREISAGDVDIRGAISREQDPDGIVPFRIETGRSNCESLVRERVGVRWLAGIGALILACAAVYGLRRMRSRQTNEIGLRLALERPGQGSVDVLQESLMVASIGIALAIPVVIWLGASCTLLSGATPSDPASLFGSAVFLLTIAGARACFLLARPPE
jgi:hypothetical protein